MSDLMTTILTIAAIIVVLIILFKVFKIAVQLLFFAAFLFVAFLLNPDEEKHRQAVIDKAGRNGVSLKNKHVTAEDYWIFSLTHLKDGNEQRTIGAGAFTYVFIFGRP